MNKFIVQARFNSVKDLQEAKRALLLTGIQERHIQCTAMAQREQRSTTFHWTFLIQDLSPPKFLKEKWRGFYAFLFKRKRGRWSDPTITLSLPYEKIKLAQKSLNQCNTTHITITDANAGVEAGLRAR